MQIYSYSPGVLQISSDSLLCRISQFGSVILLKSGEAHWDQEYIHAILENDVANTMMVDARFQYKMK